MGKRLRIISIVLFGVGVNIYLLINFNTLNWPYLWPQPMIYILLAIFVSALWFREFLDRIWWFRLVGLFMLFTGESYVLHSFHIMINYFSPIALVHFIGTAGAFGVITLSFINQLAPKRNITPPPLPAELPMVAIAIPTYGEPYDILEKTVIAATQLDYPRERLHIVISDDGHRAEIQNLAKLYHVHYSPGPRKDAKAGNLNSVLAYLKNNCPQATLLLTQDADEIIAPSFLQATIGYFNDPRMAFVQTPKEALTPSGDPFGNRDRIFYDVIQAGRNGSNAAFSCGSGVLWSISALESIGGFSTWNLVEDLTTSYLLHSVGYRSDYHDQVLSVGLSPDDIPGLLKQRGTWAADTWRLFLFDNPLLKPGLSWRQRLQYLELTMFYVTAAFFIPLLMFTPMLSLATGQFIPIEGAALFPWAVISTLYYIVLSQGNLQFLLRMWQYWVGHWPTYTKAFWIAIRSRRNKPTYIVTNKVRRNGFFGILLWPQFLYLIIGAFLVVRGLFAMPEVDLATRLSNVGTLSFYLLMVSGICRAAFYGLPWFSKEFLLSPSNLFYRFGIWVLNGAREGYADGTLVLKQVSTELLPPGSPSAD